MFKRAEWDGRAGGNLLISATNNFGAGESSRQIFLLTPGGEAKIFVGGGEAEGWWSAGLAGCLYSAFSQK